MSPSADNESIGISAGKPSMKSPPPLRDGSHSQPPIMSPELDTPNGKHPSLDEILVGFQQSSNPSSTTVVKRRRKPSSEIPDLSSEKKRDDPLGDLLTQMLNDGRVPHFGYRRMKPASPQAAVVDDSFRLFPLFTSRNGRAIRKLFRALWDREYHSCKTLREHLLVKRECQTMRFILESFVVIYIAIYSLNDIVLRSVSEFVLVAMLWMISTFLLNVEEVKNASRSFARSYVPHFLTVFIGRFSSLVWEVFYFVERTLLWGNRFQGRILLWSDEETLLKFRKGHSRLLTLYYNLKQNRKDRRKTRKEKRKRDKRGEAFTTLEIEKMVAEYNAGERLMADIRKFARKPPTFFRENSGCLEPGIIMRHDATKRHMESLQFCQKIMSSLLAKEEQEDIKPVSIHTASNGNGDSAAHSSEFSPKDTVEVVDQFPAIYLDVENDRSDESLTLDLSYDLDIDSSWDDDEDDEDDEDESSTITNTSDSTARSMPWLVVGAKIGHKLLNSRRLQRVIANPDAAKKLIPEEAKKLFDVNKETKSEESTSPSKSESRDDSNTIDFLKLHELPKIKKPDQMKPPVHGMRTSVGSTAKHLNTYGATALVVGQSLRIDQHLGGDDFGYKSPAPSMDFMPNSQMVTTEKVSRQTVISVPVRRLSPIEKGVKMVVPMFSLNCPTKWHSSCFYQMGTVISSRRIYLSSDEKPRSRSLVRNTNCLTIKVILDKAFLRGGKFVEMDLRIMDEWGLVPPHSKFPIGSCVATTFGIGVLVGWRVEDDCHIIRSLWKRGGQGSGTAYLRRDSIHSVVEAAVGFDVQTTFGAGNVVAYVRGGKNNTSGKYLVRMDMRCKGQVLEFDRCQIISCQGAAFAPVTEHIRAAAIFRLQILQYKAKHREQRLNSSSTFVRAKGMWRNFSEYVDLFANSFSKAIAEDPDFDSEFDKFVSHIIDILDGKKGDEDSSSDEKKGSDDKGVRQNTPATEINTNGAPAAEIWNINDILGCLFVDANKGVKSISADREVTRNAKAFDDAHESAQILIRVLLRTISVAKAAVPDRPKLHIVLAMIHEVLLLVRQILKVQQIHTSKKLIEAWFRALRELSDTFGPVKERAVILGVKMDKKLRKHGSVAKRRILRFVDVILGDTLLLHALELGYWRESLARVEVAIVKAGITDAATCEQLHNAVLIMYKNLAPRKRDRKTIAAASRNSQKLVRLAKLMKIAASPGRSFLRLLTRDEVLSLFDRVLVRIFEKDPQSSMVINIMALNFETMRHLRTLNNMPIAGKLWETVLDAIDEELTFTTSEIPEQTKYYLEPFVKLFSLGVAHFHSVLSGSTTADWLDFLMDDEAVTIIQELDFKLIRSLEALCNDIREVFQVLPYINTIDNDILNLMDEFDFDEFLKEITDVIGNSERLIDYINEKSTILVERFLDYLPRMAIPIDKRPLQDGWVLTCRSKDGGDLRLPDVSVLRENLLLYVFGGENLFQPLSGLSGKADYFGSPRSASISLCSDLSDDDEEESVLDEVRELILSAQSHGAWVAGVGGLKKARYFDGVPHQLAGLPLSDQLKTQIDSWQAAAISDFELLESAIVEVSSQIQLQKEREESGVLHPLRSKSERFDPKSDPTIIFLDIRNLTLRLEDFGFRVEKAQPKIFDPVFEGRGSITVKNVSITLKVEVKKETLIRDGIKTPRPVMELSRFEIRLEKLKLGFRETGADWLWNALLKGFHHQITEIVETNLKENIKKQVRAVLDQVNDFIDANPHLLMNALRITMKDLEEIKRAERYSST